jgi:glucose-1-phosphate cytidylyltransferase
MKVAILAGGLGTRLSEETQLRPKPMVEIGGRPILWHIMKGYAEQGFNEFVVALGYRAEMITDYFVNYRYHASSLTISLRTGDITVHSADHEDWTVHLLNTGLDTQTGGRVKRIAQFVGNEPFMLTY